jgi:hypothetical protein
MSISKADFDSNPPQQHARVALYARISTLNQGQDPEVQLRELRQYASTFCRLNICKTSRLRECRPFSASTACSALLSGARLWST